MPPAFRAFLALLTSALLLSTPALPFDTPLSDQAVREAYFLGQRTDQKIVDFFSGYTRHLPFPKAGPYVSEIQLLTPYAQVVELSHQNTAGYSAQQAWKDYQDRGDLIRVRVRIEFTPTYTAVASQQKSKRSTEGDRFTPRALDFWKDNDFDYVLREGEKTIEPNSVDGQPIYSEDGAFVGAYVWLTYPAEEVDSVKTEVEVFAPGEQHVVSSFDLSSLR
jgi:hypothetical protein